MRTDLLLHAADTCDHIGVVLYFTLSILWNYMYLAVFVCLFLWSNVEMLIRTTWNFYTHTECTMASCLSRSISSRNLILLVNTWQFYKRLSIQSEVFIQYLLLVRTSGNLVQPSLKLFLLQNKKWVTRAIVNNPEGDRFFVHNVWWRVHRCENLCLRLTNLKWQSAWLF